LLHLFCVGPLDFNHLDSFLNCSIHFKNILNYWIPWDIDYTQACTAPITKIQSKYFSDFKISLLWLLHALNWIIYMYNKLTAFNSITLHRYHCMLSGCRAHGTRCKAPSIMIISTILVVPSAKNWCTMVASIVQELHRRLIALLDNHHTHSLMYWLYRKRLNWGPKPFNAPFSILGKWSTLQPYGNESRSQLKVAIRTCHYPEKHCIISGWLMISPLCGQSATNHMNCLRFTSKRRHPKCNFDRLNVFFIIQTTEILIKIDVVSDIGKSHETPSNVIR